MINKLLKTFFVKKEKQKSNMKITIIRKKEEVQQNEVVDYKKLISINTSLSKYFTKQRGLNVVGRGFTYFFEDLHTN